MHAVYYMSIQKAYNKFPMNQDSKTYQISTDHLRKLRVAPLLNLKIK